jgi:uncharacterized protein YdaU (DUF1376 family)
MAKAWMPFYVADYLADTGHLDHEEHGVYVLAIMHYWQTGKPLQANAKQLQSICRCFASDKFEQIWVNVSAFFVLTDAGWKHERVEQELAKARQLSEKRKESGQKGGKNTQANAKAIATPIDTPKVEQLPTQSQSQSQSQEEPLKTLSATADVALEIILQDDSLFPITNADIADWCKLFPNVDVVGTLAEIKKVCVRNPAKRRDKEGVRPHIVGCLKMLSERKETFERIWTRYPSKDGKKEAERHFRATVHTDDDLRDIHQALDRYLGMLQKNPTRPPKNGSTWFNNWQDWIDWEEPKGGGQGVTTPQKTFQEIKDEKISSVIRNWRPK